jgi:hypothetical protein
MRKTSQNLVRLHVALLPLLLPNFRAAPFYRVSACLPRAPIRPENVD